LRALYDKYGAERDQRADADCTKQCQWLGRGGTGQRRGARDTYGGGDRAAVIETPPQGRMASKRAHGAIVPAPQGYRMFNPGRRRKAGS
jgi:hypothetical protein